MSTNYNNFTNPLTEHLQEQELKRRGKNNLGFIGVFIFGLVLGMIIMHNVHKKINGQDEFDKKI